MAGKSREPRPPFVEPAFYFADLDSTAAFFRVVDHLLDRGAALAGRALLGDAGDADHLADLIHGQADQVPVASRAELAAAGKDTGRAIAGVTLSGVGPGSSGRDVEVRVLPIPDTAVGRDHHPIAIWADGHAFDPAATPAARTRTAREVLDLFSTAIIALAPAYGAIPVEWGLPSPSKVAARPDGVGLADCYVSADYVGERRHSRLVDLATAEHRVPLATGTLFLTSGLFAPRPGNADEIRQRLAAAIAAQA